MGTEMVTGRSVVWHHHRGRQHLVVVLVMVVRRGAGARGGAGTDGAEGDGVLSPVINACWWA